MPAAPVLPAGWVAQWSSERDAYSYMHDGGQCAWCMEDVEFFDAAASRGCCIDLLAEPLGKGAFGIVRRGELSVPVARACAVKSLSALEHMRFPLDSFCNDRALTWSVALILMREVSRTSHSRP